MIMRVNIIFYSRWFSNPALISKSLMEWQEDVKKDIRRVAIVFFINTPL